VTWKTAKAARRDSLGGDVSEKLLWSEVRAGRLRAARIGAGRNLLFCEQWIDEWLMARATVASRGKTESETATR
jgi:hypothetical protein